MNIKDHQPTFTPESFREHLVREGFDEFVTKSQPPNGFLDEHAHGSESKALVLEGELTITIDGIDRHFTAGTVFHLAAGQAHKERYGPLGVTYLVGRRNAT